MHLTAKGFRPEAVRCIRPPEDLGFLTQLLGEDLIAIIAWRSALLFQILGG